MLPGSDIDQIFISRGKYTKIVYFGVFIKRIENNFVIKKLTEEGKWKIFY